MLGLERLEPAHQGVVLGVGQLGGVEDIVEVVVMVDLLAQLLDFRPRALGALGHDLGGSGVQFWQFVLWPFRFGPFCFRPLGHPERRLPERRISRGPPRVIQHFGILAVNQLELLAPRPSLKLPLARDHLRCSIELLDVDQSRRSVLFGEAFD